MEKEINREMIFDGNIMQVTKEEVELEDGKHAFREVVYHHGGCLLYTSIGNPVNDRLCPTIKNSH